MRRSPDLAVLRGDIIEAREPHIQTKFAQRFDQPPVTEPVGFFDAYALNEIERRIQRIGNGVARFDKHRSATRATAYHVEAKLLGNVQIHLVLGRLETADDHSRAHPLP